MSATWSLRSWTAAARRLLALCALVCGGLPAAAQVHTLYAPELEARAADLSIAPGFLTVLEFEQQIDQIAAGQPGTVRVDAAGTRAYLTAIARSGTTDLIVEVGGRTQLFRVKIGGGSSSQRYVVKLERPAPPPTPARTQSPVPARSVTEPTRTAPVQVPAERTTVTVAEASAAAAAPSALSGVRLILTRLPGADRSGLDAWYFSLRHTAGTVGELLVSGANLRITRAGQAVSTSVSQGPATVILRRDRTHMGTLYVKAGTRGPLKLDWTLLDPANGRRYVISREFAAGP